MANEKNLDIGRISVMRGSRRVLALKSSNFQLRGYGHRQDDSMPNFFPDSYSSILRLLNKVSFVSQFF